MELEKQFRGLLKKHQLLKVLLVKFLQLCEARLDNVEWVLLLLEEVLDTCFSQTRYR
jgi:ribosomal protein S4